MENQQSNQVLECMNPNSCNEVVEENINSTLLSSEVIEHEESQAEEDSGYSSDVDVFQSPFDSMPSNSEQELAHLKNRVDTYIRELFASSNLNEFLLNLEFLDTANNMFEVVYRCVTLSLDHDDKERELISRALSLGYGCVFSSHSIHRGFQKLFYRLSDLHLDCPDVEELLSKFLARAIVDEILPPSILSDPMLLKYGSSVVEKAEATLNLPHSLELVEHIWGPRGGVLSELSNTRSFIIDSIHEYFDCHDVEECLRCISQLKVPFYLHEFVKKTVEIAMDEDKRIPLAKTVIEKGCEKEVIPHHQLVLGLKRLYKELPDLSLDVPHAKQYIDDVKEYFVGKKIITEEELS